MIVLLLQLFARIVFLLLHTYFVTVHATLFFQNKQKKIGFTYERIELTYDRIGLTYDRTVYTHNMIGLMHDKQYKCKIQ